MFNFYSVFNASVPLNYSFNIQLFIQSIESSPFMSIRQAGSRFARDLRNSMESSPSLCRFDKPEVHLNYGPRTTVAGVVGEYRSVPGLIFVVITFPGLSFPGETIRDESSRIVNYLPSLLLTTASRLAVRRFD